MNVLELAHELDLSPKRSASTNGGEYKSKCPKCQKGTDRFCIWPNQGVSGRYWCRVCDAKGDGIQFCRDFFGMTFHEACQKTQITPQFNETRQGNRNIFTPRASTLPRSIWQQAAKNFVIYAHKKLLSNSELIKPLTQRGLTIEIMKYFHLGWNPENLFQQKKAWGLPSEIKENGLFRRQWLPKGIVIPSYSDDKLVKIKIRRSEWFKEDSLPKYVEISGSKQSPSVYGDMGKPVIIVESELDAILIQQEASHLVCCVALGGASKKPDTELHAWLKQVSLILLSLDFDDAGKKHYPFWLKLYSHLRPWPPPCLKSPGDGFQMSPTKLLNWIKAGLFTV